MQPAKRTVPADILIKKQKRDKNIITRIRLFKKTGGTKILWQIFKCLHDKDAVDSETEDKGNDRDISENALCADRTLKKYSGTYAEIYIRGRRQKISED